MAISVFKLAVFELVVFRLAFSKLAVGRVVVFTALQALAVAASATGDLSRVPLHWLWNEQQTDSAYTVDAGRLALFVHERGYVDMGVLAYVDALPSANGRPLKCFYFPAPRTDTFCSMSLIEQRTVRALGFAYTSDEGYLRVHPSEGTIPLFRLSRRYGNGDDREHRFVISEEELVRMRKQGWELDGVKGYVSTTP
jgi:hypothetical protein